MRRLPAISLLSIISAFGQGCSSGSAAQPGGNAAAAGTSGTGGGTALGGTTAIGSGGGAPNGGTGNSGQQGGASPNGGSSATSGGGITSSGDNAANGGASVGGTSNMCGRAVGACTAPVVKVTDVDVGVPVTGYGRQSDTEPLPLAISALPSGGSRVAWLGTDQKVYVGELDCNDALVGKSFSFPGIDLQDVYADASGGVVLLTRDATNGGTDQCGDGMLCGGTSNPCRAMYLVRFDNTGSVVWEAQVTNLSSSLAGYQNGARFVWWYQHHGRIAYDGTNYAAYFGVAITVNNGSCVDIHEGDRMQVIGPNGMKVPGHESFEVGCSHSWTTRIVWDQRTSHFVMVCATDNNCRIARPNPYRTIATGTCDNTLFGGDLVLSTNPGYWTAWSQGGTIRLQHFTDTGPDTAVDDAGSSAHPHLVTYGMNNMLLSWANGSSLTAQVRDAGASASTVGSTFTIAVKDHAYQAFKPYSDGSVAYAATGATNTSIKVARVMPCQ